MLIFQSWPKYIESSGALLITLMINHMMTLMSSAWVWSSNYGEGEVSASEIGLNTSLKFGGSISYTPSLENTSRFPLYGTQIYAALPTRWWGRCGIFMLVPDAVRQKASLILYHYPWSMLFCQ